MPVRSIVSAIATCAARWTDPNYGRRLGTIEAVRERTGYSLAAVAYAFDRLFGALTAEAIEGVIVDELGSLDVLDRFVERPCRPAVRALPLGRVIVLSSRTTVGVAIVPAVFAACAKCDVLVKDRSDALVAAFFEALCEELPVLRESIAAQVWAGDSDMPAPAEYDAVVAFGSDATLARVAAAASGGTRFIGYGSKASAGYIAREALANERAARAIADGAATDLVLYETEGCLSLHALFVERRGAVSPERFAEILCDAVGAADVAFPPATADASASARRASFRELATFRSGSARLAVLDPPFAEPPAFVPRTLGVRSVERPEQMAEYLEHHGIALEALALAGARPDLQRLGERLRVARIARFGTLQAPPIGGFHGGRPRIAEFVRWMTDETWTS